VSFNGPVLTVVSLAGAVLAEAAGGWAGACAQLELAAARNENPMMPPNAPKLLTMSNFSPSNSFHARIRKSVALPEGCSNRFRYANPCGGNAQHTIPFPSEPVNRQGKTENPVIFPGTWNNEAR
jgi:hypothetical protein